MYSFFIESLRVPPELLTSPFGTHFTLERRGIRYNMNTMNFKNKKDEEEFKKQLQEAMEILQQQDVHFFKSEHILPILQSMTPEQLEIFEHLTGINRQTIH